MSYINFDKTQLVNLEYSLDKELLRSNRLGSYSSTTIIGCNTRKYHGLLISPQPNIDEEKHVLLSSLDLTVIQRDAEFNLGIHKYPGGKFLPKGHKYIRDFVSEPIPKITYRVGGVVLTMERLFSQISDRMLIKFTLLDAHSPTILRFIPFLAFRNHHKLSKANVFVEKKYEKVENGIKTRMYAGYSNLFMQFSKEVQYVHVPDWYYNIEYQKEKDRGYDFQEDLYVPGFFELPIKKGESVIFSAGLNEIKPQTLNRIYANEIKRRIPRDSFINCLRNSAQQFVQKKGKNTEIIAGFPWFGSWGRDTFISLPGLTLETDNPKICKSVIDTMLKYLNGSLFPNIIVGNKGSYNSVDASLWFFWTLQKYSEHTKSKDKIWKEYGKKMMIILDGYRKGTLHNIKMLDNGLIYAGEKGKALTWMDAISDGKAVTPRIGIPVEINALWYNAIMFSIEIAMLADANGFVEKWKPIAEKINKSFTLTFWNKEKGYLADYVDGDFKDWSVRPNQIFAASLPYSPISEEVSQSILDIVENELLTTRGIRTLSPKNPDYQGTYFGDQATRDKQYHQGTVWPWLFGHFVEAYLKIYGKAGVKKMEWYYEKFEDTIKEHGIGTISEVYDGNPPHKPGGAISQAWSVAELLRVDGLLKKYSS